MNDWHLAVYLDRLCKIFNNVAKFSISDFIIIQYYEILGNITAKIIRAPVLHTAANFLIKYGDNSMWVIM